ncbi:sugar ABC transporter substrate-binding protein [Anaerotalea alkaliphila]|uniref:Sugar ABC transporter substrate-binding protein n=1 Tax=Anaerotalea alkaliphila TaxID=2662126 RepID=A0A7X5KNW0_9FIRM|nr:sugar ABC transporter substrate-binding protein [Anaerotalea alkaliphila]NDL67172.1 sugar ABC transporter substrate-binding protein [Anaerotalea alkaliphila]
MDWKHARKNRIIVLVAGGGLLLCLLLFALLQGSLSGKGIESLQEGKGKPTVAVVLKALDSEHWERIKKGAERAAREYGADLVVMAPDKESNVAMQFAMVQDLLKEDIDALCIAPCDSEGILPLVTRAKLQGIPVFTIDTNAYDERNIQAFIGTDNYKAGILAGERMREVLPEDGKVAVMTGLLTQQTHGERLRGFRKAMEGSGLEMALVLGGKSESDTAYRATKEFLREGESVDGIFVTNALMAIGVLEALKEEGMTGQIRVIGFDDQKAMLLAVGEGHMDSTITQDPYAMGYLAVESSMRHLRGEALQKHIETPAGIVSLDNLEAYRETRKE